MDYIADAASPDIAWRFTNGIVDHLETLADHPRIGTSRDDLRPGLRTLAHRHRVTIAFMIENAAVVVIGFYYGGQDFETLLQAEQSLGETGGSKGSGLLDYPKGCGSWGSIRGRVRRQTEPNASARPGREAHRHAYVPVPVCSAGMHRTRKGRLPLRDT